jgi:catechol 2,3-dioxygenase-like lactoylglutathione lyase family enzyme
MLRGAINHLDLTVADPDASAPFYDAVLGFLGFARVRLAGDPNPVWQSSVPGQRLFSIALCRASEDGARRAHDRRSPGLHHVAFQAASRDDVDRLYALLRTLGAKILDPPAAYPQYGPDYYALFFSDPDGLKLELVHMSEPPALERRDAD